MNAPRITPTVAVELQDELFRFWLSERGEHFFSEWQRARKADGMGTLAWRGIGRSEWEARAVAGARLYLISEDMLALADHATRTMPKQTLMPEDLPCPNGFMVFERGLPGPDVRDKIVVELAILWKVITDIGGEKGVAWTFYSDMLDDRDQYFGKDQTAQIAHGAGFPRAIPMTEDGEGFGIGENDAQSMADRLNVAPELVRESWRTTHRLAIALFALIRDWADVAEVQPERAARRRLERARSPVVQKISVVRLRRAKKETDEGAPGSVEWSRRWIVSGFWRQQPHGPGRTLRRLQWIPPFVKGPADKPLVVTRKVFHLDR